MTWLTTLLSSCSQQTITTDSTRQVVISCTHWHFRIRRKFTNILESCHPVAMVPVWLVMVVKQLVLSACEEEAMWQRWWRFRVLFQCLSAALGGSSILGFPHSAGGIRWWWESLDLLGNVLHRRRIPHTLTVTQRLDIHLSPMRLSLRSSEK